MIPFLTYLLLLVTPLIVAPWLPLRFEPPKVFAAEAIIQILVIFAFLRGKLGVKTAYNKLDAVLLGLLGLLFFLSLGHFVLSPSKESLFGNIFRLQGTILFWHLLALCFIAKNTYFKLKDKYIYLIAYLAVFSSALIFGSNRAGRWVGSLGEPNALGAVIVFIFPLVFLGFKQVWIKVLALTAALVVINFTESKSALIGISIQLLVLLLIKLSKGKYLLSVIICLVFLTFTLGLPVVERIYFLKTNTDPMNFRFEDRAQIWQVALVSGLDSPIYGTGLDKVQEKIHKTAEKLNFNAQYQTIDSSHNLFLDYWIWGGGFGLVLLLSLVILTVRNLVSKRMLPEIAVFLGLLAVLSFNPATVSILAGFWWIMGRSFAKFETE